MVNGELVIQNTVVWDEEVNGFIVEDRHLPITHHWRIQPMLAYGWRFTADDYYDGRTDYVAYDECDAEICKQPSPSVYGDAPHSVDLYYWWLRVCKDSWHEFVDRLDAQNLRRIAKGGLPKRR